MKIAKEIKIAVLAISSLVIFYIGFNYLKGVEFFDPTNEYYALYEKLDGLTVSNPVLLSGLSVGRVSDIEILQDDEDRVKVYFEVREGITLGTQSVALLSTDLLGTQTIVLQRFEVTDVLLQGSEVIGKSEQSLTAQIQEQAYPVLKTLDSVGRHLNGILENIDSNEKMINGILADVKLATSTIASFSTKEAQIKSMLNDFKKISGALADEQNGLKATLAKTNGILDSVNNLEMNQLFSNMDSTIQNMNAIIASMNDGEGTVDKLLSSDSLYNSLNQTMVDLDKLLIDFREQPKRYVHFSLFGKKEKKK
ncbi:MAG: phospholipid/cholesterol/gamma-HCH transport system substrate-binding protein [Marivirga sp.]